MIACKDCKFCKVPKDFLFPRCYHPNTPKKLWYNWEDGRSYHLPYSIETVRENEQLCGKEARGFAPKSFWQKFLDFF